MLYIKNMETGQNCTKGKNCRKITLHGGSISHELQFRTEGHFGRE